MSENSIIDKVAITPLDRKVASLRKRPVSFLTVSFVPDPLTAEVCLLMHWCV